MKCQANCDQRYDEINIETLEKEKLIMKFQNNIKALEMFLKRNPTTKS